MYAKYYRKYIARVWQGVKDSLGWNARTILLPLLSLVIGSGAFLFLRGPQAVVERGLAFVAYTIAPLVALTLFFLLLHLIRTPAIMYDDLGGFDELRLGIRMECSEPRGPQAWVTFRLFNRSLAPIEDCRVQLASVEKASDSSWTITSPEWLSWSSDEGERRGMKEIAAGGNKKIDLAYSDSANNGMMFDGQRGGFNFTGPDEYVATITITGIYRNRGFERQHRLQFSYEGGTRFSCVENMREIAVSK
jgi:hypothetical protein